MSGRRLPQLSAVNAATALHRIAKWQDGPQALSEPLFACLGGIIGEAAASAGCDPRGLSNSVWAFATLGYLDQPLLTAIAAASISRMELFGHQGLANTAWSFSTLAVHDMPLFEALASASIRHRNDFDQQDLSNTVWAFATLRLPHIPLLDSIS